MIIEYKTLLGLSFNEIYEQCMTRINISHRNHERHFVGLLVIRCFNFYILVCKAFR